MQKPTVTRKSIAETIIGDAVTRLVQSETLKNTQAARDGAALMARQILLELQQHGLANKQSYGACLEIIKCLES